MIARTKSSAGSLLLEVSIAMAVAIAVVFWSIRAVQTAIATEFYLKKRAVAAGYLDFAAETMKACDWTKLQTEWVPYLNYCSDTSNVLSKWWVYSGATSGPATQVILGVIPPRYGVTTSPLAVYGWCWVNVQQDANAVVDPVSGRQAIDSYTITVYVRFQHQGRDYVLQRTVIRCA